MKEYKKVLKEEVEAFRELGHRFLNKEISKNEFKGQSGGMGVYAQQDQKTFMIRLRTPSGIVTKTHLNLILSYAKKYQLDKVHLTTRQAVQLHNLKIDDVCDIMYHAIDHDLYTRGGGGNFPRNVSLSPLAGVEKGEAFDVTPYALLVGQYFLKNATGYHLPRKLKAAFSSGVSDTACATVNDIGFMAVLEEGRPMFRMWLAGGLGGGPAKAIPYRKMVKPEEVLYYIEAMIQTFIAEGDYENKAKARIRFIPRRMGEEEFSNCYERHLKEAKETNKFKETAPVIEAETVATITSQDTPTVIAQKQKERYTVVLHPLCGQLMTTDLEKIAAFVSKLEEVQIRLSMEEDMYIRNLTKEEAEELLLLTKESRMCDTPIQMSLSCVGTPSCQMGILQSQKLCKEIITAVSEAGLLGSRLPKLQISGCPNSCARHQIAEIGFTGRKVKVGDVSEDAFTLQVGGKTSKDDTHLGEIKGVLLGKDIPQFIVELGVMLEKNEKQVAELLGEDCFEALVEKYVVQ